jgi:hypothetical protein
MYLSTVGLSHSTDTSRYKSKNAEYDVVWILISTSIYIYTHTHTHTHIN